MSKPVRRIISALLLGVVLYGAAIAWSGFGAIAESLGTFHWIAFAAAVGLATFNYLLRFLRWEIYLDILEVKIPRLDSLLDTVRKK